MFGGTFNPIHEGHIKLALDVHYFLKYDEVQLVPNYSPPLKINDSEITVNHRVDMIKLAINDYTFLSINEYEIDDRKISYTINTITHIYETQKFDGKLGLVIGCDQAQQFEKWKNWEEILSLVDLIIAKRGGKLEFNHSYIKLDTEIPDISSTQIRNFPMSQTSMLNLNPNVIRYIVSNKLYGVKR